jgi:hypothetical protein
MKRRLQPLLIGGRIAMTFACGFVDTVDLSC